MPGLYTRKGELTIHVWREPVDETTVALVAHVETTSRGCFYALSTFLMVDRQGSRGFRAVDAAKDHLRTYLEKNCYGQLPYIRSIIA